MSKDRAWRKACGVSLLLIAVSLFTVLGIVRNSLSESVYYTCEFAGVSVVLQTTKTNLMEIAGVLQKVGIFTLVFFGLVIGSIGRRKS
jgi:hypothetical protein